MNKIKNDLIFYKNSKYKIEELNILKKNNKKNNKTLGIFIEL